MQTQTFSNVHAYAEALHVLLSQLTTQHENVLPRQETQELEVWQSRLQAIQADLRQSFLRLPSDLRMDHPDVIAIVGVMTAVAHMANDCKRRIRNA